MSRLIRGKKTDLDGFSVTRILPHVDQRMVGPFVFIDHMGPADFDAGSGIDVRPHPHIGLATITYLLEGSLLHRDSLGNHVEILPGDVNWMTAGKGIVHSERETHEVQSRPHRLDGMQCWVALPRHLAEISPSFEHIKRCNLPQHMKEGVQSRLIAGEAFGMSSPIRTYSPMFYLDVLAREGRTIPRPNPHHECLAYVLQGEVEVEGSPFHARDAVILDAEQDIRCITAARVLLLGGEAWLEKPRMFWNFVSFDKERIEQAKKDWESGRFPSIPGDDAEFTPLPARKPG